MILLDTSGLFASYATDEPQSQSARSLFEASEQKLTHSYVLSELITLAYVRNFPRSSMLEFVRRLLAHPQVEVAWVDEQLHLEAMELLETRQDKAYSLCDAVSFVLMRRHAIAEALTTDHHFEQEGFTRLLAP